MTEVHDIKDICTDLLMVKLGIENDHAIIRLLYDKWMVESTTAPGNEGTGYHNAAVELKDAFPEAWEVSDD